MFNEVYENEKKIMFAKMDKMSKDWRSDKKTINKVKMAARISAENLCKSFRIGNKIGVSAKEVLRIAVIMHISKNCKIEIAFDMINYMIDKGETWEDIVKHSQDVK